VEQGICLAVSIEITAPTVEKNVRDKECRGNNALADICSLRRKIEKKSKRETNEIKQDQRRKNTSNSPIIEAHYTVGSVFNACENDSRDKETGNHEKDVDSDETSSDVVRKYFKVKKHDGQHRKGT
jgi:hypothetical protein